MNWTKYKHYRYWTPLPLAWMFSIVSSVEADGRAHRPCNSVGRHSGRVAGLWVSNQDLNINLKCKKTNIINALPLFKKTGWQTFSDIKNNKCKIKKANTKKVSNIYFVFKTVLHCNRIVSNWDLLGIWSGVGSGKGRENGNGRGNGRGMGNRVGYGMGRWK
jgi:hypothetical protein